MSSRATQISVWAMLVGLPLFAANPLAPEPEPVPETPGSPAQPVGSALGAPVFAGSMMPRLPQNITMSSQGAVRVESAQRVFFDGPGVHMKTDSGIEVFADSARVDLQTHQVLLKGNLAIYQSDPSMDISSLIRAEQAQFDWDKELLTSQSIRTKVDGLILSSKTFELGKDADGVTFFDARDAALTAEDLQDPGTWIKADAIRVYPGDRFTFKHLSMHYGSVPFFYFPYFSHSLNPEVGYLPIPGVRSIWGPYLLNQYGFLMGKRKTNGTMPTADYLGIVHADYRVRRGMAYGLDVRDVPLEEVAPDMTGLSLYYTRDQGVDITAADDENRRHLDPTRWRAALQQMWRLSIHTAGQWRLKTNINMLSDEYMLRDFYPDIYQRNSSPDNTVQLAWFDDSDYVALLHRFVPNHFYIADQRTELSHEHIKSPIKNSAIMYESRSSLALLKQYVPGFMRMEIRDMLAQLNPNSASYDYWNRLLMSDSFSRAHTFHEFSALQRVLGFLNLTPKVGVGYTGYYGMADTAAFNQAIFYGGIDADFKFSKHYHSVYSDKWGINGMNHIVQPYFTLAYVRANHLNDAYPQIDGASATTNPSALTMGTYTEIDSLATNMVFRYGLKNMLMTMRDQDSHRWLSWDVFMDAYLYDSVANRQFSNLFSYIRWNPVPWIELRSEMQAPVFNKDDLAGCNEYNTWMRFMPWRSTEFAIGYRYLTRHPILQDNSQLDVRLLQRFSDAWSFGGRWRAALRDGELDIQEYNVYHNMGSWYLGMGAFVRKNGSRTEYGLGVSFTVQQTGDHMPFKLF